MKKEFTGFTNLNLRKIEEKHEDALIKYSRVLESLALDIKEMELFLGTCPIADFQYSLPGSSFIHWNGKRICYHDGGLGLNKPIMEWAIAIRYELRNDVPKFLEALLSSIPHDA